MLKDLFYQVVFFLQGVGESIRNALLAFPRSQRLLLIGLLIGLIPAYFVVRYGTELVFYFIYNRSLITARAQVSNPASVSVGPVSIISLGENNFSAYAEVTNPNLDIALANGRYEFRFTDTQGQLVTTKQGQLFLLPNQKKLLVVPRFASEVSVSRGVVAISDSVWQKRFTIIQIPLRSPEPRKVASTIDGVDALQGNVTNDSPYRVATVRLVFSLYDSRGKLLAVTQREEYNMGPFETRTYNHILSGIDTSRLTRTTVQAETNNKSLFEVSI
jgi:hypothetical protein